MTPVQEVLGHSLEEFALERRDKPEVGRLGWDKRSEGGDREEIGRR